MPYWSGNLGPFKFTLQRYIESDLEVMIIHYLNLSDVDVIIIHYLNLSDVNVIRIHYLNESYFAGAPFHYLDHPLAKSLNDKITMSRIWNLDTRES